MNEADKKQFEEILERIKDNVRGFLEAERLEQAHSEGEVTLGPGASPAEFRAVRKRAIEVDVAALQRITRNLP